MPHVLFLVASARETGVLGNTEWLARRAAQALPAQVQQTWLHLAQMQLEPFVDVRHAAGRYPMPSGDMRILLDASLAATHIVWVSPVYWYSFPACLKTYIDHWSAWMRVEGLPFKEEMARKTLCLITTSGDRQNSQPMIDAALLCGQFLKMRSGGALWAKGGPPNVTAADPSAAQAADRYFGNVDQLLLK